MGARLIIILALATAGCQDRKYDISPADFRTMACYAELYCLKTEDSITKRAALAALSAYLGSDLGKGLCSDYYDARGIDYRPRPTLETCRALADDQANDG